MTPANDSQISAFLARLPPEAGIDSDPDAPQVIFPQTAWGGYKQSSIGRELGPWGLAAFQEIKHVIRAL